MDRTLPLLLPLTAALLYVFGALLMLLVALPVLARDYRLTCRRRAELSLAVDDDDVSAHRPRRL